MNAEPVFAPIFCMLPLAVGAVVFLAAMAFKWNAERIRRQKLERREPAGIGYTVLCITWILAFVAYFLVLLAYLLSGPSGPARRLFDRDVMEGMLVLGLLAIVPLGLLTITRLIWVNRKRLAASIQYAHDVPDITRPAPAVRTDGPADTPLPVARPIVDDRFGVPQVNWQRHDESAPVLTLPFLGVLGLGLILFVALVAAIQGEGPRVLVLGLILASAAAVVYLLGKAAVWMVQSSRKTTPGGEPIWQATIFVLLGILAVIVGLGLLAWLIGILKSGRDLTHPFAIFWMLGGLGVIGFGIYVMLQVGRTVTRTGRRAGGKPPVPPDPWKGYRPNILIFLWVMGGFWVIVMTTVLLNFEIRTEQDLGEAGLLFVTMILSPLVILGAITVAWYRRRQMTTAYGLSILAAPLPVAPLVLTPDPVLPRNCPKCGRPIAAGAPEGLCPRCLLGDLLPVPERLSPTIAHGPFIPPTVEEVAEFFPQFEIKSIIGQGGMGAVYLARQPSLDRHVALKIIRDREDDPTFAERFAREARAMARLSHPNIVSVHESGVAGGLPYLVMEYVDGVTLREAMRAKRLTPAEALKIIPQVCDALEYAHRQGVVHRDVKPENILLDRMGRVKIADFGLAKVADADGISLTRTQQAMGTPHYMAPEQWEKPSEVDHRADIYALGVVLYELLTGELPLGRFDPPSVKARVDARIDELVLRALAKEPGRRFQNATDVKVALARLAEGGWVAKGGFREYRSKTSFLGWPLVHIVGGRDPLTGRGKVAKGWIAIGDGAAIGGLAIAGGHAAGGVAIAGGGAFGLIALAGGYAVGLFALAGGFAAGILFAGAGGVALSGGVAMSGGFAAGSIAIAGGYGVGAEVFDPTRQDFQPLELLQDRVIDPLQHWWTGTSPPTPTTVPYNPVLLGD